MKSAYIIIVFFLSVLQYSQSWKHWKRPVCDPVSCGPNCREVYNPRACPTCVCDKPLCSTPLCPPGCKLQTEFKGPCPECDCDVDKKILEPQKPVCPVVDCIPNCYPRPGPNGCSVCKCDVPLCSPPKCDPGCEIETVYEGPCPGCKCDKDAGISDGVKLELKKPLCDPVKCLGNCREAKGPGGCPVCLCDPQCSPPLCPPGCEIEKDFVGPCPGCKCDRKEKDEVVKDKDLVKALCDPVKCLPPCTEAKGLDGCPVCECKLCAPPKCPPGCEVEKEFDGPCPGCKCQKDVPDVVGDKDLTKALCDPVKCLPSCKETVVDGCPKCDCPPCSPPKCPPGCEIEKVFDGPCPGCKCEKEEIEVELKKDCPPEVDCSGSCKPEIDENGCKKCVCKPECSIPLCKPGCFIKNRADRCPYCQCSRWAWKNKD